MTADLKVVPIATRACRTCGVQKTHNEFVQCSKMKFGITYECKACRNEKRRNITAEVHRVRDEHRKEHPFKICSRCKEEKNYSEFAKASWTKIGITPDCRQCRNARYKDPRRNRRDRIPAKYGITFEHAVLTLANQGGLCANRGCGKEISLVGPMRPSKAVIDHDHQTGKFRAVLCMRCNLTLGELEKDPNKFMGLVEYMNKHKAGR